MDLNELRREIDAVDSQIVELVQRRMDVAAAISEYKWEHGLAVLDSGRESAKLDAVAAQSREDMQAYVRSLYQTLMDLSKDYQKKLQGQAAGHFGLIGEHLGHSFSPQIHGMLCSYAYDLYEVAPDELEPFLSVTGLQGMNVTIPYKKAVIPLCASLSETAARIGSVNTLVLRDGGWHGDNTDYDGFRYTVERSGVDVAGKKALVLGNGGVCPTVCAVLEDLGAGDVVVISRRGEDNYTNLARHADAKIIVNTTPLGMYPHNGEAAVDLADFPACEAVYDLIYNPARTALLLDAERRGLTAVNGLGMLVAQAKRAAELFTGKPIPAERVETIRAAMERQAENLILIGMPGCGKSSVGALLAAETGRSFVDADEEIELAAGMTIQQIFASEGEEGFRERETAVLAELGKRTGTVIATGGGCVTREENYPLLHQNGRLVWLRRALDALPTEGRPLSQANPLAALYAARKDKYAAFADIVVDNDGSIADAVKKIREEWT